MPTFRDINQFNRVSQEEVNPDWSLQISATQRVTLRQIADLAVNEALTVNIGNEQINYDGSQGKTLNIKGNIIRLEGMTTNNPDYQKKKISSDNTVTGGFERLMQILGAGYNDDYAKLQVIGTKSSSYLYTILRLMETISNKNLDFIADPGNKVVGFLFDNTQDSAVSALTSAFKFQAKPWSTVTSGTALAPNQVHTSGMSNAVNLTKSAWDAVNIGSAAVIVPKGSSKTLSTIVTTLVSNVKSAYTVYGPNSDQYDLLDATANAHMVLVQKLGTYMFVTVSPMTQIS